MWRVRLGLKFTDSRVINRNFPTLEEAHEFVLGTSAQGDSPAEALRNRFGSSVFDLSPRELAEAQEAINLLKSSGGERLINAVRFFMKHSSPAVRISLGEAIDGLIRAKETQAALPTTSANYAALFRHSLASSARSLPAT